MTSLASTIAAEIQPIRHSSIPVKVGLALVLAALADWLFYGQRIGLSLTLFAIAMACVSVLFNHAALDLRRTMIGTAILVAGLVPAVEELNMLSFLILVASLTIALLLATNPETTGLTERVRALRNFVLFGPFRFFLEALQIFNMSAFTRGLALWLLPAALGTVFVALFAAQSILDGIYLWGHVALPDNLTYAAYAHRGAYPLIATALLAAAFVLVAMRPGGAAEKSKVIRPLVYLWVGQNVLLVASSILRLDLYVDIYMLTYWRIAAFIWMGLVALGLVLIVTRIALNRSNQWLVGANLIALTIVLYGCSLVNFDAFIADYNVTHSREASGKGVQIDINYLLTLGPQALPAIDKAILLRPGAPESCLVSRRDRLVEQQRQDLAWRSWGFRSWRLQRRLDAQAKDQQAG
ncbi:hypothetical protein BKD09_07880 [Bradyrhizobium japonicum]|uniref:Uncharacterized protein n=1 Tax=Bradyrhizobium japonicum TaxID=375 RepID=A0A1L3F4M5_BRAJP|nr:DUF4173 domain-containing protein [Bradyrhizobium japonicum]APG08243.1 hypothetical protein BKD09_07880 [Bradyrhizobium japonicum]